MTLLPRRPKVRESFAIIFMDGDKCQLRAGNDVILMLRGRTVEDVLPTLFKYLNGSHTVSEISEICKDIVTEEGLHDILKTLHTEGILEDAHIDPPSPMTTDEIDFYAEQLAFFGHFERDKLEYQRRLKLANVAVVGCGSLGAAVLHSLVSMGVGRVALIETPGGFGQVVSRFPAKVQSPAAMASCLAATNPHIRVETRSASSFWSDHGVCEFDAVAIATDRPEFRIYEEMNRAALAHGIPWMICSPLNSVEGAVGPFFIPFETCCFTCYDLRVKSNITAYSEYAAFEAYALEKDGRVADYGYLPSFPGVLGSLVAAELLKHFTGLMAPETYGRVFSINFITLETQTHAVLKIPRCPDCGPASHVPPIALWSK